MKQILKKNQIIISVIAIMLIAAGYMNYTSNEKQALETAALTDSEKYAGIGDATLVSANVADDNNLEKNDEVQNIIDDSAKNEEKKDEIKSNDQNTESKENIVQNEIKKINDTRNAIMIAENLIKNKGFQDLIIFINGDSISIIVKAKELKEEQIAQIQNIISRELKGEIENIHISNKE